MNKEQVRKSSSQNSKETKTSIIASSLGVLARFAFLMPIIVLVFSCGDDGGFVPKPRGYFRIGLPEKNYIKYDSICPFTFDYPDYSIIKKDIGVGTEFCWLNMEFPTFKSTLHLSYKPVDNNLGKFLEDSREFAIRHQIKASGIDELVIIEESSKVYGLLYHIKGNTASSLQFYLTDSIHHFIRGSLYFQATPNSDSIAPVLEFVSKDIYRMIDSFEWK